VNCVKQSVGQVKIIQKAKEDGRKLIQKCLKESPHLTNIYQILIIKHYMNVVI
jgi:hypothetical protein